LAEAASPSNTGKFAELFPQVEKLQAMIALMGG
jgi:hypothetical protein